MRRFSWIDHAHTYSLANNTASLDISFQPVMQQVASREIVMGKLIRSSGLDDNDQVTACVCPRGLGGGTGGSCQVADCDLRLADLNETS